MVSYVQSPKYGFDGTLMTLNGVVPAIPLAFQHG